MAVYTVWGPPRSGKTTLAIDLAYAFALRGESVCLISPERYSELSARMRLHIEAEKSLSAVSTSKESLKHIVLPADDLLYVLAVPLDNDAFGGELSSENAKSLLTQAETIFDVIIVDCPSHCGSSLAAWAMSMADTVLLLTGSTLGAAPWFTAYRRAVEAVEKRLLPISVGVCADFDYASLHQLIGQKPELRVPFYPDAEAAQSEHRTLYGKSGKAGRKYTSAIDDIYDALDEGGEDE